MKKHASLQISLVCAVLALGVLGGCSKTVTTHGQIILPSRLAQIKPGVTTRQEVQQLLGSPSTTGTLNDTRWYYVSSVVTDKPLRMKQLEKQDILIVDFNEAGTVSSLTRKNESDLNEIQPEEATTRTYGQSLGIVDQLIGNLGLGGGAK